MTQKVRRIELTGAVTPVSFDTCSGKWLVKNFGSGNIYVSFTPDADESARIKIPSGVGQLCVINERYGDGCEKSFTVYLSGSGEVEVQQLWW